MQILSQKLENFHGTRSLPRLTALVYQQIAALTVLFNRWRGCRSGAYGALEASPVRAENWEMVIMPASLGQADDDAKAGRIQQEGDRSADDDALHHRLAPLAATDDRGRHLVD